jgi:hypothetical protein
VKAAGTVGNVSRASTLARRSTAASRHLFASTLGLVLEVLVTPASTTVRDAARTLLSVGQRDSREAHVSPTETQETSPAPGDAPGVALRLSAPPVRPSLDRLRARRGAVRVGAQQHGFPRPLVEFGDAGAAREHRGLEAGDGCRAYSEDGGVVLAAVQPAGSVGQGVEVVGLGGVGRPLRANSAMPGAPGPVIPYARETTTFDSGQDRHVLIRCMLLAHRQTLSPPTPVGGSMA